MKLVSVVVFALGICFVAGEAGSNGINLKKANNVRDISWEYQKESKTVIISGSGAMEDFQTPGNQPWRSLHYEAEHVIISEGITTIGNYAFYDIIGVKTVELPSSLTRIGENAFCHCSNLTSIVIPSGVTEIGSGAFHSCSNLKDMPLPNGITTLPSSIFYGCSRLTQITIPPGVTSIGRYAFYYCSRLTSVIMPSNLTEIDEYSFSSCSSLVDINLPSGLKEIGNHAFHQCISLRNISIPSAVESIRTEAFSDCISLTSVTIPSSVTSMGSSVFARCHNLTSVSYLGSSEPNWYNKKQFEDCDLLVSVCVPSNYSSSSFCWMYSLCKTDSCESVFDKTNQCFGATCNEGSITISRRPGADEWEKQTTGCSDFKCVNESGLLIIPSCLSTTESVMLCTEDAKCADEANYTDYESIIVFELFRPFDVLDIDASQLRYDIGYLLGMTCNWEVASEMNEDGKVARVFVFVPENMEAARVIAQQIKVRNDESMLYMEIITDSIKIYILGDEGQSASGVVSQHQTSFVFMLTFFIFFVAMMNH